jgi:hypothetical protein
MSILSPTFVSSKASVDARPSARSIAKPLIQVPTASQRHESDGVDKDDLGDEMLDA